MSDESVGTILAKGLDELDSKLVTVNENLLVMGRTMTDLNEGVTRVEGEVEKVSQQATETQRRLSELAENFDAFVQADLMAKALQKALTRRIEVRQVFEKEFGHYDEVRRLTVGILQATDLGFVRHETIKRLSEEQMLTSVRYWLCPGLIALSAWLSNDRALAEKAMVETVKRDDNKASLYFALISRRGNRRQASAAWLHRFFSLQNPVELDRELVVLIDAVASGVFGSEGRSLCAKQFDVWLKELSERAGFTEQQRDRWSQALASKEPSLRADEYPYLRKYCPVWDQADTSLRGSRLHKVLHVYFENIFAGEVTPSASLAEAVDDMLDQLVKDYDKDELPLRREMQLLDLIVEEGGDESAAQRRCDTVKQALEARQSFTQLVTNAAMHPEIAGATKASQRFAVAMSRDWIVAAHDDLTAKNRAGVPHDVPIKIESWDGKTQAGENETKLLESMKSHWLAEEAKRIATIVLNPISWGALALGALVTVYGLWNTSPFLIVVGLAGIGWYFYEKWKLDQTKVQVRQHFNDLRETSPKILKAVMAEIVDWRKDYAAGDAQADELRKYFGSITTEQHMLTNFDSGRSVLNK
jgi:hypothetical protein